MNIEYIISGLVGLVTGAVGSLLAPWVNWKIEERKEIRKGKIDLIRNLRTYLGQNEPKEELFLNSTDYIRIRPYLPEPFVKDLENLQSVLVNSSVRSFYKAKFLEELETIEERWNVGLPKKSKRNKNYNADSGISIEVTVLKPGESKNDFND